MSPSGRSKFREPCSRCTSRKGGQGWCDFGVNLQHTDWEYVISKAKQSAAVGHLTMEEGVQVHVVDNLDQLPLALKRLKDSMKVSRCSPSTALLIDTTDLQCI